MCALKLSKFQWAKCLCDCVLQYEPTNVKALFRRASAALRLGLLESAKNDLTIAKKVEPNNGDVLKEWNKVNLLLLEATANDANSSSCVDMEVDSKSVAPTISSRAKQLGFNPLNLPTQNHSNPVDQVRLESVGSNMDEPCINNLVGSKANLSNAFVDPPRVNGELEDTNSISGSSRPFLKTNLAEPKRFSNQSRPGSILNLSPPDYKRLAAGQVLCYHDPHSVGFMSVRVKRFTSNPDSISETQEVKSSATVPEKEVNIGDNVAHILPGFMSVRVKRFTSNPNSISETQEVKSSATIPEKEVNIGDNVAHILPNHCVTAGHVNDITPTPMQTINQAPPTIAIASNSIHEPPPTAAIAPNSIHEPLSRQKVASNSSLGNSRLARRHPFVPAFNSRGDKRQLKRPIKRITKSKVHPTPGMKRKCRSNTFISSYPPWKRRVLCNWDEKFQDVIDCSRNPLNSSSNNNMLHWVVNDSMASTVPSFSDIVMNKLNISL